MYLVIDTGGTTTRGAGSENGNTLSKTKIIPTEHDFEKGITLINQTADELSNKEKITAIAGGIAGPLDHAKSMLIKSPHIAGWVHKPLKQELERVFECKVYLENDTAVGGLGEAVFGAGKDRKIVAYLAIGTGVGGCRIVNGQIDANSLGFEPGHQIILENGSPCNCGGKGHLETLVGGYYLERAYKQKAKDITDIDIWKEVAKYLSLGLSNTIVHWSPDVVVLGGGVTQHIPLEEIRKHVAKYLTIFPNPPEIVKANLGNEAGLFGALKLIS